MDIQLILLGILQGLLEWLPVSSSGQISLFYSRVLGLDPLVGFKLGLAAHLGTGLSAIVYFRKELREMLYGWSSIWFKILFITTLSALPIGYLLFEYVSNIESTLLEPLTGAALIGTGFLLYLSGRYGIRDVNSISTKEMVLIGVVEGFAVLPGLSRSALTIASLSILGFNSRDSVRISFLMAIPVTILAGLYQFSDLNGLSSLDLMGSAILLSTSFLTGLLTIGGVIYLASKLQRNISIFLIVLGGLVLTLYLPLLLQPSL